MTTTTVCAGLGIVVALGVGADLAVPPVRDGDGDVVACV
jgi:hypothetical protein